MGKKSQSQLGEKKKGPPASSELDWYLRLKAQIITNLRKTTWTPPASCSGFVSPSWGGPPEIALGTWTMPGSEAQSEGWGDCTTTQSLKIQRQLWKLELRNGGHSRPPSMSSDRTQEEV